MEILVKKVLKGEQRYIGHIIYIIIEQSITETNFVGKYKKEKGNTKIKYILKC
mgnify:CR=1 FL=1